MTTTQCYFQENEICTHFQYPPEVASSKFIDSNKNKNGSLFKATSC